MCDTCKEFCDEYKIGKGDLILSNEYIFEPYFSQYVSGATVVYVEKYGTGEPSDEMVEAIDAYKDKFEKVVVAEPLLGEVGADATEINADKKAVAEDITAEAVKTAGYDSLDDAKGIAALLNQVGAKKVQLLPFHQFGENKYHLLGKTYSYENVKALHPEDLTDYQQIFLDVGIDCFF